MEMTEAKVRFRFLVDARVRDANRRYDHRTAARPEGAAFGEVGATARV
jgi:hypothetical protein